MERYEIGNYIARKQRSINRITKIAAVGNVPIVDTERFAETVAVNRGAIFRVFVDITEAIDGLEE